MSPGLLAFCINRMCASSRPNTRSTAGNGKPVEKWILRKAVEDVVPEFVLWRPKAKFWQGAGVQELLSDYAEIHRQRRGFPP